MYLKLDNLSKSFGDKKVLDNLSLEINKGELISLLGPSGCGKTTALKLIGGFLKEDCGSIQIDGEEMIGIAPELRPVSTVFQSYALFPHMTVLQNVIYGLKFKGYKKKDAIIEGEKYLAMVDLLPHKNKKIGQLSGGQQQRVALIRSLIVKPKVLLLDEPLSNLDAKLRVKMREEIKSIQKKFNITMIFVTHDQEEAMSISDKIAVMNDGKLEQIGSAEEIYNKPANAFVLDFIGNSNIIKAEDGTTIFVRPECIKITKNSGDVPGKIISRVFMGSYVTYIVQTEHGIINVKETADNEIIHGVNEDIHLKLEKTGRF